MNIKLIAEIIGGFAALFRVTSLFAKAPEKIKLLVTLGNFLFMVQGIINKSPSLFISNFACLIAYAIQYFQNKKIKEEPNGKNEETDIGWIQSQ